MILLRVTTRAHRHRRWRSVTVLFSYARPVAADNPISQLNMKSKAVKDKGI